MSSDLSLATGDMRYNSEMLARQKTHQVKVGNVALGGGTPVVVQSMLNASSASASDNLDQIQRLYDCGCEVIRMAIPSLDDIAVFSEVCEKSPLPLVADIHFDYRIAIQAAKCGAAKLRINPGNIGGLEKTALVIEAAKEAGIPIRIGVNAGSLDKEIAIKEGMTNSEKLALSAIEYVHFFEDECDFHDIVVSAKAHDVLETIATYRTLSKDIPHIPLHIGITEAGTAMQGLIKSASGLGILLEEGIGDTIRISLTDDPTLEVRAAWQLLGALSIRRRGPEIISCPTCGRCKVDLIGMAKEVTRRLADSEKPIKVAVMGCVVNGPGEAADADVGIASGDGQGVLFRNGRIIKKVDEKDIVDTLISEIEAL